jgi:class 3 adenylate cyclase
MPPWPCRPRRYADEVRRTHGLPVQMRVGLNSGEVVVRAIGNDLHMDYSAVGLTTVLAARMEQLATPGSILLTVDTLRLVEGMVQVTSLGPVPVKGVDEPVEVFELVGASAIRRRLQAAVARGLTRFVGRQAELAALHQVLRHSYALPPSARPRLSCHAQVEDRDDTYTIRARVTGC